MARAQAPRPQAGAGPDPTAAAAPAIQSRVEIMGLLTAEIPRLRRFARTLARTPDRADDLVQEALARAIARIDSWQPGSSMRAWLFAIVHNTHISAMRRVQRSPINEDAEFDNVPSAVEASQETKLEMRDLATAFGTLPAVQRQVLMLVAVDGLDYADAATVLGVPVGTVRSRLSRARDALRAAMGGVLPGN